MLLTQLVIVALLAVVVTLPIVLLIPRQRQSPIFDRVLWGGTWLLAVLGAFAAPSYVPPDFIVSNVFVADLPAIPTLIGAVVGALSINGVLVLLDHFSPPEVAEKFFEEEENVARTDNSDQSQ